MRLAIDTNAYSSLQIGNVPDLKQIVDQAELIALPYIVDAELRAGFQKGRKKDDNYNKLQKFENLDRVLVVWPDDLTNELYAKVWSELASKGKPIPTKDVWIAAISLQHQLTLATSDKYFDYVPLLQVIKY